MADLIKASKVDMAGLINARRDKLAKMAYGSKCLICDFPVETFERIGHLQRHVDNDSLLLTRFDSLMVKQFHVKSVECGKCRNKFSRQIELDIHKMGFHMHDIDLPNDKYLLICKYSYCGFNTTNREELIAHEQLHKVVERCPYCADFSGDLEEMRRHYDDKHSKWGCVCRGCEERFPSIEEVDVHEQKHCAIFVSKYPDLLRS